MSIEVRFIAEGTDTQVVIDYVRIGQSCLFADYSNRPRHMIIEATCFIDNRGGEVHIYPADKLPERGAAQQQTFDTDTLEAIIPPDGSYEHDIVTQNMIRGHLVLQHVTYQPEA